VLDDRRRGARELRLNAQCALLRDRSCSPGNLLLYVAAAVGNSYQQFVLLLESSSLYCLCSLFAWAPLRTDLPFTHLTDIICPNQTIYGYK
jgi:hypothetical protein